MRHEEPIRDDEGPLGNPATHYDDNALYSVSGRVWHEHGNERQLFSGATYSGDTPATGFHVWGSTLTDEGVEAYKEAVESLPPEEQAAATKELLEEHPEYISATVVAPVAEDGRYTLRFPDDRDYNQDYLYLWVENPAGEVVPAYSTFTQPVFQNARRNLQWSPAVDPAKNNAGLAGKPFQRWHNVNFAVVPFNESVLDIVNHDTEDNPARPGDTAKLELSGQPTPLQSTIVWVGPNGDELQTCEDVTPEDLGECASFPVPEDAKDGDVYTAQLRDAAGNIVAADSFVVADPVSISYDEVSFGPEDKEREAKVEPTLEALSGKPAEPREDQTFRFGDELPEGFEVSEDDPTVATFKGGADNPEGITATIDPETGVVTVTAGEDAELPDGGVELPVVLDGGEAPAANGSVSIAAKPALPEFAEIGEQLDPVYEPVVEDQDPEADGWQSGAPKLE
ncbi:hypothetical protein HMPREF9719_00959, partial [Corynebacterium otitidis ATCC 51513]